MSEQEIKLDGLRKAAVAVFLACEETIAQDLADKLNWAVSEIINLEAKISKISTDKNSISNNKDMSDG